MTFSLLAYEPNIETQKVKSVNIESVAASSEKEFRGTIHFEKAKAVDGVKQTDITKTGYIFTQRYKLNKH